MRNNYFTEENTDGYSTEEIQTMNNILDGIMHQVSRTLDYNEIMKNEAEKILNNF